MVNHLGPQFLYHGTAMEVEGPRVLPAKEHGKGSYWGDTGSSRGEPANAHAWAHPSEEMAWKFAHDRVIHTSNEHDWNPRARVYAVNPNKRQSAGHDSSIPGEVKAPYFDVAERIDTMPGRQGTFPEVNWNHHVVHTGLFADDEDANHPRNLSVQFGHREGRWGDHWNGAMRRDAEEENVHRSIARATEVAGPLKHGSYGEDAPLPGMGPTRIRSAAEAARWR